MSDEFDSLDAFEKAAVEAHWLSGCAPTQVRDLA
jgi:hypothetical protein